MVIYPFVFAIFPILFLYAFNIDQTPFKDAIIPLLISLAAVAVLFLLLWLALKSAAKAGLISSVFVVLFFSYGPFLHVLHKTFLKAVPDNAFTAVFALVFILLAALIIRHKGDFKKLTKMLNVVAVVLIALSIINITVYGISASSRNRQTHRGVPVKKIVGLDRSKLPDVYYIILDAYVGQQTLKDFFKYDNSEFTGFLKEKGFYVASESRSNYPETFLSLASSLNMEYVNFLTKECGKNSKSRYIPYKMIENNAVSHFFKLNGYKVVVLASNWVGTRRFKDADLLMARNTVFEQEFTDVLIKSTLLRTVVNIGGVASREGVQYMFSELPEIQGMIEGPRFVFAHVICPHPPYLFDRNGNPVKDSGEATTWGDRKDDYLNQLIYVNKRIKQFVSEILAKSKRPPVIILQADHGTAFVLGTAWDKWIKPSAEGVRERTGILNAYYLPALGEGTPYETITPVNSFRLVFDRYFKTSYGQLDNRVYWSSYDHPYVFIDVTDTALGSK